MVDVVNTICSWIALISLCMVSSGCDTTTKVDAAFDSSLDKVKDTLAVTSFSREMEQDCVAVTVQGWEGFPTRKCDYRVAGMKGKTSVVLLDADDARLHRWIASACLRSAPSAIETCATRLAFHTNLQSGGQFPVAGIVMEDMDRNGVPSPYPFRDGVTVALDALPKVREGDPTAAQTAAALTDPPSRAKSFARIASTTRDQYLAVVPDARVKGLDWLTAVRQAYQKAWTSDENLLISAWALANAADLGG